MMKKYLLLLMALGCFTFGSGQTATNFACNDCAGMPHNLFNELDSGQVVVICWVMPCSSCISGALSAQSACNAFSSSNPGQVVYYCADDYANTSCGTLSTWCSTNGVAPTAKFSNTSVSMSNYGAAGMPKVIVLGGAGHTVYYNQNGSAVTTSGIQAAIATALNDIASGVTVHSSPGISASVAPNPAAALSSLTLSLEQESQLTITLTNLLGEKVADIYAGRLPAGESQLALNLGNLPDGTYLLGISDGKQDTQLKLVVAH
jgi:hypothetical protein